MKNQEYWLERALDLEESLHRPAELVVADLDKAYRSAERQIEADISRWYQRFANNNGIVSLADARKLLTSGELKEFKWTLEEYRKHAKENLDGRWQKELENASARWHISRLEALKYQLQNTAEVLYGNQLDSFDALLKQTYLNGYGQTAYTIQVGLGIGWDIAGLNDRAIKTVLYKPWALDGRNFSDRIWENKQALVGELHKQLTQNLMRGGNLNDVIDSIEKKFGVSRSNAARLVYTENAYAVSVATGDSYRATGVEKVTFIATLDERTSDVCRDMDGTIIDMKDYQPGVTVPPLHPWCRSTTAPYFADMAGLGERIARDEDGKNYFVPRDMKYHDWEKTFMKDPKTGEAGSKEGLQQILPGAILSLGDCKTVTDVEQWMKQQGWFRPDSSKTGTFSIRLSGVDFEAAKGIAEAYEQVMDEFPCLIGNIDAVQAKALDPGVYAQCFTRGGGRVEVSTRIFKNVETVIKTYQRDLDDGFHPVGTDWKAVITHELGHALDGYLTNIGAVGSNRNGWDNKDVSAFLRPKVMKACGLKVSDAGTEVSYYATKNAHEWFAECFAEAVRSGSPRKVATEFMKQLKEIIQNSGVK